LNIPLAIKGDVSHMLKPSINLLVLHAANIDASLAFYGTLGLDFVQEQHGSGPVHYSCEVGATVVEIYPGKPGTASDRKQAGATTIGFQVADVDKVVGDLQSSGAIILTAPQASAWGRRAVVQDSDGRAIELSQPPT
jgi:lactoylglutathione lyase